MEERKATPLKGKTLKILCGIFGGILVLAVGLTAAAWALDPYDHRILDNVHIGGVAVGGMTKGEAREALEQALKETLLGLDMTVELPEQTLTFSPDQVGLRADISGAVRQAYRRGRIGSREERQEAARVTQAEGYAVGMLSYLRFSETVLLQALEDYADTYATTLTQPEYHLEGERPALSTQDFREAEGQVLVLTKGLPQARLDVDGVYAQILADYDDPVTAAGNGEYGVTLDQIPPEQTPEDLDLKAIYEEVCVQPVDDSLDMETYRQVYGSYGYGFSLEAVEEAFAQAAPGQSLRVPLEYVEPEILGEEVYFRDVLGDCQTKHSNNEKRTVNLQLICQILNGYVLQPGESFSFNGVVGERTEERGFQPAPAFSGNQLVNSVGGGVCQTSTTLYNCVLEADLEVIERRGHGATVTYVPLGLDAAVNWGTTDFAFRNNFHFPVKIQAEVSDGYVKMQLLGTDEKDYYIEMTANQDNSNPDVIYAVSYKNKYDKETGELISREREAFSTYNKNVG